MCCAALSGSDVPLRAFLSTHICIFLQRCGAVQVCCQVLSAIDILLYACVLHRCVHIYNF